LFEFVPPISGELSRHEPTSGIVENSVEELWNFSNNFSPVIHSWGFPGASVYPRIWVTHASASHIWAGMNVINISTAPTTTTKYIHHINVCGGNYAYLPL
jgi:hypothetical protein